MKRYLSLLTAVSLIVSTSCAFAGKKETISVEEKAKYGPIGAPIATTLAQSNEYFRKHAAPGFWPLISYYIPQSTDTSCGTATLVMALNAAKSGHHRNSEDKVITETAIWEKEITENWAQSIGGAKLKSPVGVILDDFGKLTETAFHKYGFPSAKIHTVTVSDKSQATHSQIVEALKNISAKTLFLANFDQKTFTDDYQVGHYAPVGAFDEENKKVLILDPDRAYFEPYWVSLDTFIDGMNSKNKFGVPRGYVLIETGDSK